MRARSQLQGMRRRAGPAGAVAARASRVHEDELAPSDEELRNHHRSAFGQPLHEHLLEEELGVVVEHVREPRRVQADPARQAAVDGIGDELDLGQAGRVTLNGAEQDLLRLMQDEAQASTE